VCAVTEQNGIGQNGTDKIVRGSGVGKEVWGIKSPIGSEKLFRLFLQCKNSQNKKKHLMKNK